MSTIREHYNPGRLLQVRKSIEARIEKGLPIQFEIFLDGILCVPRTNNIADFDCYDETFNDSWKRINLKVYDNLTSSKAQEEYIFIQAQTSVHDISRLVDEKVSEIMTKKDLEESKKQLEDARKKVEKLESDLEEYRKKNTELNGIDKEKKRSDSQANQKIHELRQGLDQAKQRIVELEQQLEEAKDQTQLNWQSLGAGAGAFFTEFVRDHPAYGAIAKTFMKNKAQPVNGPASEPISEMTFREKPEADSELEDAFKIAFRAAMGRFDANRMQKFNTLFNACLDDPALVDRFEAQIPKQQ